MSSILFSSQPATPSPLSRSLPVEGDVLEHVRVRAVKHDLPPRTTRSRSSSHSSVSSSSSSYTSSGTNSPATPVSPAMQLGYNDFTNPFLPHADRPLRPPFSRRGSDASSESDHTLTPIRLAHGAESSRDIAQAFNGSALSTTPRHNSHAATPFPRLTPPGSPSPYLNEGHRRRSVRSLASTVSRESLRRPSPAVRSSSGSSDSLYYVPPESPFSANKRTLAQTVGPVDEEEDITVCYHVLGFGGFGV